MIYIRVDMNETIATGHMMRCLSIADAARRMGYGATFILADRMAVELLDERGYRSIVLNTQWDQMDAEIDAILRVIEEKKIHRLLVDSYQVTEKYLSALKAVTEVVYIDDMNSFVYPVDKLICYANYANRMDYTAGYGNTELFLGTDYAPLRHEFADIGSKYIKPSVENVAVLSGGTDHYGIIEKILDAICGENDKEINVICGRYYQEYSMLVKKYQGYGNVRIHRSVDNIVDYMVKADVAISAGGVTLYELCACGTPAISYSFADNQFKNVRKFDEDGIIDYAGDVRSDDVVGRIQVLLQQYRKAKVRRMKSIQMRKMVDGKGAGRIVELLVR